MSWSGFVGIDPTGLVGLADSADQCAIRVRLVGQEVAGLLRRRDEGTTVPSTTVLANVEQSLGEDAAGLRWRVAVIEAAQSVGAGHGLSTALLARAEFAARAVFRIDHWQQSFRRWITVPDVTSLSSMQPAEVRSTLSVVAPSQRDVMARAHPQVIGGLEGAPVTMRYLANRILIGQEIARLRHQIDEMRSTRPDSMWRWLIPSGLVGWFIVQSLTDTSIDHLERQIGEYQRWLDEDRQILLFDTAGDGRVIEVFGDLDAAAGVAVVVPGMATSLDNFSVASGGFRANAAALYGAAGGHDGEGEVATITWLGYDTPDGGDAVLRNAARAGAPELAAFVAQLDPAGSRRVSVIAHSYGSVVAGLASATGLAADDLVFVGSPGTTLDVAGDAVLRLGGRVWVALADGDLIAAGLSPQELPPGWLPPTLAPGWFVVDMVDGAEQLWHGTNPAAAEFGALRITTNGSSGHSSYFESGSLDNLALIVTGRHEAVELHR